MVPWDNHINPNASTSLWGGQQLHHYVQVNYYPARMVIAAYDRPVDPRRMRKAFDTQSNKVNASGVPPVLLSHCTEELYPKPLVVRFGGREWRAKRRASARRHLPLRSRPGGGHG